MAIWRGPRLVGFASSGCRWGAATTATNNLSHHARNMLLGAGEAAYRQARRWAWDERETNKTARWRTCELLLGMTSSRVPLPPVGHDIFDGRRAWARRCSCNAPVHTSARGSTRQKCGVCLEHSQSRSVVPRRINLAASLCRRLGRYCWPASNDAWPSRKSRRRLLGRMPMPCPASA